MLVKVYTGKGCGHCVRAKGYLEAKGVAYEEIDIHKAGVEYVKTVVAPGATSIPIVIVDGQWIGGADQLAEVVDVIAATKFPRSMLTEKLRDGVVSIKFEKTDGTEREMVCTLNQSLIPVDKLPKRGEEGTPIGPTPYDRYLKVFDMHSLGWRSVNLTTIKSVKGLT